MGRAKGDDPGEGKGRREKGTTGEEREGESGGKGGGVQ